MVVFFYYPVKTPQDGQCLLEEMDIPGEAIIDEFGDKNEKCIIWKNTVWNYTRPKTQTLSLTLKNDFLIFVGIESKYSKQKDGVKR